MVCYGRVGEEPKKDSATKPRYRVTPPKQRPINKMRKRAPGGDDGTAVRVESATRQEKIELVDHRSGVTQVNVVDPTSHDGAQ